MAGSRQRRSSSQSERHDWPVLAWRSLTSSLKPSIDSISSCRSRTRMQPTAVTTLSSVALSLSNGRLNASASRRTPHPPVHARTRRAAQRPARVYLTGGATATLEGWRASTIDIDLKLVPDDDALLRAIPELKESLQINVELAAPIDFIPVADGWEDRGRFIAQEGRLAFYDFDLTAQALSKIERGHRQASTTCVK